LVVEVTYVRQSSHLQNIGPEAVGDSLVGFPHRVTGKMRLARDRLHPAVAEQPADDRQAFSERERPRGEGVTSIVVSWIIPPAANRIISTDWCGDFSHCSGIAGRFG